MQSKKVKRNIAQEIKEGFEEVIAYQEGKIALRTSIVEVPERKSQDTGRSEGDL